MSQHCDIVFYAMEKFEAALRALPTGYGDLKDRLHDAFEICVGVEEGDIPETLRPRWTSIVHDLTKTPSKHPKFGAINSTLRGMKKERAVDIAQRIYDLTTEFREMLERE